MMLTAPAGERDVRLIETSRTVSAALLLLAAMAVHSAEPPADGLYLAAREPNPAQYRSQDGQTVYLGAKADPEIVEKVFKSQGNTNDSFRLLLGTPYRQESVLWHVLVVAGKVYRQTESSGNSDRWWIEFRITGDDSAREVSKYLGVPVVYYRHPGHHLRVTITTGPESFAPGADIFATLQIENIGIEPVAFMKGGRTGHSGRNNQFIFTAYRRGKTVPDIGEMETSGGTAVRILLKPGESTRQTVLLNEWFGFKETGVYNLHGSYYMVFTEPEPRPGEAMRMSTGVYQEAIWTDFVGADFNIRIK